MSIKFSEDIVPLTDMKINPGKVVKRTNESHRPVLLTSRGRGVVVVQSLDDFEQAEEEKAKLTGKPVGMRSVMAAAREKGIRTERLAEIIRNA